MWQKLGDKGTGSKTHVHKVRCLEQVPIGAGIQSALALTCALSAMVRSVKKRDRCGRFLLLSGAGLVPCNSTGSFAS